MDIWILIQDSQMANNLVKWWKNKFLNGYKQFSVECGDGKVSDTEELLGRLNSDLDGNETACTTPPLHPTNSEATSTPTKPLNFEEFSCDVSVEDNETQSGQERQEFSFTLYDFDGHGKITKDDIAGLVTTIYEALGSSVKVPHYGSKTIKVKLTVSPEQRKHVSATLINEKDKPNDSIRYKRDLNVTIRQGTKDKVRHCRNTKNPKKHHCCNKHKQDEQDFLSDDSSDVYSRVSGHVTTEDDEEGSDCERSKLSKKQNQKRCQQRSTSPMYTIPNLFIKETLCNENSCKKSSKKRSGSLQRQELLEIIQANMDKNNLGFQTPRKHSNHVSTQTRPPMQHLANFMDPTHLYVDFSSLQKQQPVQYEKLLDAVMCVSTSKKCHRHRHESPIVASNKRSVRRNERIKTSANHFFSPQHHLRHRNRQEDQARAMAQVVRWLEQEFSAKEQKEFSSHREKGSKTAPSAGGVERHEHHHVHEHVHHHYHHYQETPLVV